MDLDLVRPARKTQRSESPVTFINTALSHYNAVRVTLHLTAHPYYTISPVNKLHSQTVIIPHNDHSSKLHKLIIFETYPISMQKLSNVNVNLSKPDHQHTKSTQPPPGLPKTWGIQPRKFCDPQHIWNSTVQLGFTIFVRHHPPTPVKGVENGDVCWYVI